MNLCFQFVSTAASGSASASAKTFPSYAEIPRSRLWNLLTTIYFSAGYSKNHSNSYYTNWELNIPGHAYYPIWRNSVGNFVPNFDSVLQGQTFYWPYLKDDRSDLRETIQKCIRCYWVNWVIPSFDLTHHIEFEFSRSNFLDSCISGIFRLLDMKRKESKSVGHWAEYVTLFFDHTHNLITRNGRADWHGTKWMWINNS